MTGGSGRWKGRSHSTRRRSSSLWESLAARSWPDHLADRFTGRAALADGSLCASPCCVHFPCPAAVHRTAVARGASAAVGDGVATPCAGAFRKLLADGPCLVRVVRFRTVALIGTGLVFVTRSRIGSRRSGPWLEWPARARGARGAPDQRSGARLPLPLTPPETAASPSPSAPLRRRGHAARATAAVAPPAPSLCHPPHPVFAHHERT